MSAASAPVISAATGPISFSDIGSKSSIISLGGLYLKIINLHLQVKQVSSTNLVSDTQNKEYKSKRRCNKWNKRLNYPTHHHNQLKSHKYVRRIHDKIQVIAGYGAIKEVSLLFEL